MLDAAMRMLSVDVSKCSAVARAVRRCQQHTQQLHELCFLPLSIRGGLCSRLASSLLLPSGVAHQVPLPERWC